MDIRELDRATPQLPLKVHTGVLYKELPALGGVVNPITKEPIMYNKPIYIVEHLVDPTSFDVVIVYSIKDNSKPPVKAFDEVKYETQYKGSTSLGALANQVGIKTKRKSIQERPPLFVTPVLQGVDTFTGQEGMGFFEREKDNFRASGKVIEGAQTGVFITLDSVTWNHTFVPAHNVLSDYLTVRDVWFNISDGQEI